MGGFALEISDRDRNFFPTKGSNKERPTRLAITDKGLLFLAEHRPELIPDFTRAQIEDKSKGSMFAKLLVCFQGQYPSNPRPSVLLIRWCFLRIRKEG